jgi:hypothetical protein
MSTLTSAISDATKSLEDTTVENPEVKEPPVIEPTVVTPPAETLDERDIERAKDLYRAIKDPKSAVTVIKMMAESAGLLNPTQTEVKEVAKTIQELIAEGLGSDYAFLAEKLGTTIETVVKAQVAEQTKDLRENAAKSARNAEETRVDAAIQKVFKAHDDAEALGDDILKLMDKVLPSPDASTEEYFENLYLIAASKKTKASLTSKVTDKLARNRSDAVSKIASAGKSTDQIFAAPQKMSAREAIALAVAELDKG